MGDLSGVLRAGGGAVLSRECDVGDSLAETRVLRGIDRILWARLWTQRRDDSLRDLLRHIATGTKRMGTNSAAAEHDRRTCV